MEISPGFKQTEAGPIPDDWDVKILPEVCRFRGGKAHEQYISDLGEYVCVNSKFISTEGEVRKYSLVNLCPANERDILMVMSDLPNGKALAKAYLVESRGKYAVNQRVCALTPFHDDAHYLFYVLNRNPYFLKFDNGVSQTHLLNPIFKKCPLPLPPTVQEQRAIATTLSDVDALLDGLTRLIAKKRDLKQATMQQLLTGQTRLPGFGGAWELVRADEIGYFKGGSGFPIRCQGATTGDYPFFKVSDMNNVGNETFMRNANNLISESVRRALGAVVFPENSIVFAKVGAAIFLERKKILITASCLDNNMAGYILDKERSNTRFIHYMMLNTRLSDLVSATALPALNGSVLGAMQFLLPSISEQAAIANVLSDMDAELTALEARLTKTRALKQAMMSELLTGKTRLPTS